MKKLIIAVVIVAILGGIGLYGGKVFGLLKNEVIVYTQAEPIVTTEKVDTLEVLVDEAQNAARAEIENTAKATQEKEATAAKAAYEAALAAAEAKRTEYIENELTKISDKVKADYIAEIEATITSPEY